MINSILFIVPPSIPYTLIKNPNEIIYSATKMALPLGVLSISAYLKKFYDNLKIDIIDFNAVIFEMQQNKHIENYDDARLIFREYFKNNKSDKKYDIIGISAIFDAAYSYLVQIAKECKQAFTESYIIAGGGLPSNLYDMVLTNISEIDAICYGEGEISMLELIDAPSIENHFKSSNSWISREDLNNIEFRPSTKYIDNLDEIPLFDYTLIDLPLYFTNNHYKGEKSNSKLALPVILSRGCPYRCCFCSTNSIHGNKVRYSSIDKIRNDINYLIENYNLDAIIIWDDNFFANRKRAIELLEYFIDLNIEVQFSNGLPVYCIDEEIAKLLSLAGSKYVSLAIESGSQRVLDEVIHKPLRLDMVEPAISLLRKYGLYIRGFFLLGIPGETIEDIELTIDFIRKAGFNWINPTIATPLSGSEMYQICIQNGYLVNNDLGKSVFTVGNIKTCEFSPEEIEEIQASIAYEANFVNNYDMKIGNYEIALDRFENVMVHDKTNAFAYYFASQVAIKIGDLIKGKKYYDTFERLVAINPEWKKYINKFGLDVNYF